MDDDGKRLPPKEVRRRRGRKSAEESADYGPLTIRISNKLRYGLELLARAQHRSLSQAVEWALQVGLNAYEVGSERESLGSVLDKVWAEQTEAARLLHIYWHAPGLLEFEDFVTCELIDRSRERLEIMEELPEHELGMDKLARKDPKRSALVPKLMARVRELEDTYGKFVISLWPLIRVKAIERANLGKPTQNVSLLNLLGLSAKGLSTAQIMEATLKHIAKMSEDSEDLVGPWLAEQAKKSKADV